MKSVLPHLRPARAVAAVSALVSGAARAVLSAAAVSLFVLLAALAPAPAAAQLAVVGTVPARHTLAPTTTAITVHFNSAVSPVSVTASNFRVFGRGSGRAAGTFTLLNGGTSVRFTPTVPFFAGEIVSVNLSRNLRATNGTFLRAAGYFFSFTTAVAPTGPIDLEELDVMSNLGGEPQTRIYGVCATDLNNDNFHDIATINETSADVRVALSLADGSGLYHDFQAPVEIGVEASPNEPADFNWDGKTDLCVSATGTDNAWILLGAGDGTFTSVQSIAVGSVPHGIMALDVDGDADWDVVNVNQVDNNLSLLINNGIGLFGAATFFEGGVNGEYGLATADMNEDGISDLVVAGEGGSHIVTLLGNGNGTFTAAAAPVSTGGWTWVVTVGDVNGDGHMDAATANSFSNHVGVLKGNGDGTFQPVTTLASGGHTPGVELGDLDGDGDMDLVASSFGAGIWRFFTNNGAGAFTFLRDVVAPSNPSCAAMFDFDNDHDLDVALTDEIDDVVVLMENMGSATGAPGVTPGPEGAMGLQLTAAPNPFRGNTTVRFYVGAPAAAQVDVVDVTGRIVWRETVAVRGAGWQSVDLGAGARNGAGAMTPGVYFVRVTAAGRTETMRVVRVE